MTTLAQQEKVLAQPYALALLQWPATLGLLTLSHSGWWLGLSIALALWLGLMLLAGYAGTPGGRAARGNAMLLSNVSVAAAWWTYPTPWFLVFLTINLLLLYTAQRAGFRAIMRPSENESGH